ncbi:MAG: ion transporter [Bacteroidales bacterium]|jgi:voltage-gated potassium channel|nr:ion transporter [Bacteroidales bacterium]
MNLPKQSRWKTKWFQIIFRHDTKNGRLFDELLLVMILLSVSTVFVDSIPKIHAKYQTSLYIAEWFFTLLFTAEYIVRIIVSPKKKSYIFSYYGIIDFASVIPTYLSLVFIGSQYLIIIRILRLLRVFRILKLVRFTSASLFLLHSLKHSREKILVFFGSVLILVTIIGTFMYLIEGPEHGFKSIPYSIYWAIVTVTTVGYGDISPSTALGQIIASMLMLTGYAIIAVPTGIISSEMTKNQREDKKRPRTECPKCGNDEVSKEDFFCSHCGYSLKSYE